MEITVFKKHLGAMIETKDIPLPSNVSPEAFRNAAIVAFTDNPKIRQCEPESIFKAVRRLASLGLVPDGTEAAMVPFKTKVGNNWVDICQAMPMVHGLVKRARNSGEITDIRAHIVYQREVDEGRFEYIVGDEEKLVHHPILFGERGDPVAAYAIAKLRDGAILREFMSAEQIDSVRRAGSSQKIFRKGEKPVVSEEPIGIWADWTEEMWKKSVIRRLCKRLPLTSEDRRAIQQEPDLDETMKDVTPKPTLFERLAGPQEPEAAEPEPEEPEAEDAAPEPIEGEVVRDPIEANPEDGAPMDDEWDAGMKAFDRKWPYDQNPWLEKGDQARADSWAGGWKQREKEAK